LAANPAAPGADVSRVVPAQVRPPLISRRAGAALGLVGVISVTIVTGAVLLLMGTARREPTRALDAPAPPAKVAAIVISRPEEVEVHMSTYQPGQSSSWHRHTGLHAVAVVSGTLTVYGPDCQAHAYGPGEAYVGGQSVHLARNETDQPLEMAVTYLFPAGSSMEEFLIQDSPPAGCRIP
jgi:quercetin dioxygenase-like cupin family protein